VVAATAEAAVAAVAVAAVAVAAVAVANNSSTYIHFSSR
jgi:hypothetical protein